MLSGLKQHSFIRPQSGGQTPAIGVLAHATPPLKLEGGPFLPPPASGGSRWSSAGGHAPLIFAASPHGLIRVSLRVLLILQGYLSLDVGPPSVRVTSSQIPYLPHTRETLPPDEVAFPGTGARGRASHLGAAIQPTTPQKGNCWRRWALARGHLLGGWMLSSLRIFFSLLSFFQGLQHKREKCSFDVVIRIQTLNVSLSG